MRCAAVAVENRGDALTDDACRGLNKSARLNKCVNTASPVDTVAVAVHRTALTDDGDRNAACAAIDPVDSESYLSALSRSLCKLIGVVHKDINCSSSSESNCIRSAEADLHNPGCSSDSAGTVVDAPLNVSPALSPHTSLAQPHSAKDLHSVPYSRQQGEYPPRVVTRVRGDLSPPCHDGVYPQGVQSDSASPAQAGGKILGLVAPLTHVAVSSPVAEFDPSGLVRAGPACHSIARQSSSQSEAHTALSTTDGLREPLDSSKFPGNPSCGPSHAPTHTHSHTAFQFQLASSQCPLSTGEPSTAVTPERHSAFLRPEFLDNLGDKSVGFIDGFGDKSAEYCEGERLPGLVDDDTSSGEESAEEEGSTLVRHEADSLLENRGEGKGSTTATAKPIRTVTERSVRSGSIGSTLSGSSGRNPNRLPLAPLTVDTACGALSMHEPVAGSVLRDTPNYHGTVPVAHRTAVGEWKPTARIICSMLHAADIRGRWEAVVHARLRKWKKRCKSRLRNELKQEKWHQRNCQRKQSEHMTQIDAVTANTQ